MSKKLSWVNLLLPTLVAAHLSKVSEIQLLLKYDAQEKGFIIAFPVKYATKTVVRWAKPPYVIFILNNVCSFFNNNNIRRSTMTVLD